jgi:hypothetical protein
MQVNCQLYALADLTPRKDTGASSIVSVIGPRVNLGAVVKRRVLLLPGIESEPDVIHFTD